MITFPFMGSHAGYKSPVVGLEKRKEAQDFGGTFVPNPFKGSADLPRLRYLKLPSQSALQ